MRSISASSPKIPTIGETFFDPSLYTRLAAKTGLVTLFMNEPADAISAQATNKDIAGYEDSSIYPKADLVVNGQFENWSGDQPDNWSPNPENASNYVTEDPNGARIVSDGTIMGITQVNALTIGKRYKLRCVVYSIVDGATRPIALSDTIPGTNIFAAGTYDYEFVATYAHIVLKRATGLGCDAVVSSIECWEVNPLNLSIVSVTPGEPGQGVINPVYLYDGSNDYLYGNAAAIDGIFSLTDGTFIGLADLTNSDATARNLFYLHLDSGDEININRLASGSNNFSWECSNTANIADSGVVNSWALYALTLSSSNSRMRGYFNKSYNEVAMSGALSGTVDVFTVGSKSTSQYWAGYQGPFIYAPYEMTPNEIYEILDWGGIS